MKVVILAGGFGTRISEESYLKPKPMVEIGGRPILWHIMKYYSSFGFDDFIICLGYKGTVIKEYFSNYYLHASDITIDFRNNNTVTFHHNVAEPWRITLVDTGLSTMTGGRIKRIAPYIEEDQFMVTYGDGLSDVNLHDLLSFHRNHSGSITITSVQPKGRFGVLNLDENSKVEGFIEKPEKGGSWINAGYMVMNRSIFDFIDGDQTELESNVLLPFSEQGQLFAYQHHGFWQPMDTVWERNKLETLFQSNEAPWVRW